MMPKIAVLATGGTISGKGSTRMDLINYKAGAFTIEDMVSQISELHEIAEIKVEQLNNFSSTEMTPYHWSFLRSRVEHYLRNLGFDGVVITHGTNTIEETAYFLHLTCNTEKPIVITGAQRPLSALSSDAQLNLFNAVRLGASKEAIGKGVLVLLNDEINGAREVTKTNTYRLETFQSGQIGLMGYVDSDGTVIFYRQPTRKHTVHSRFNQLNTEKLKEVEIVYSYAGNDGKLIRSLLSTEIQGIVVAGTGAGLVSSKELDALQQARKQGICVVRSSRVGNGRVLQTEKCGGSNFIAADNLLPQKARILLMLALQETNDTGEIQNIFNTY